MRTEVMDEVQELHRYIKRHCSEVLLENELDALLEQACEDDTSTLVNRRIELLRQRTATKRLAET